MPSGYRKNGNKLGFQKGHILNKGKNNPHYTHGKSTKKTYCIDCKVKIYWRSKRCLKCDWANKRKYGFNQGSNNPAWVNGVKIYAHGWRSRRFKEYIISIYGYQCQLCGKLEKNNGQRLHLHHVDYNKANLKPKNLIPLCRSCHPKTNFNRNYWKGLLRAKNRSN